MSFHHGVLPIRAHKNRSTDEKYPVDGVRMIKLSFTLLAEISDAPKT